MASLLGIILCFLIISLIHNEELNKNPSFGIKEQVIKSLQSSQVKYFQMNEQYKLKLSANSSKIIYLNNSQNNPHFSFHYTSLDIFETCILNSDKACPTQPIQQSKQQGSIEITNNNMNNGILLINSSLKKQIHLSIKLHLINNNCHYLLPKNIYNIPLTVKTCFIFNITTQKDHEIILQPSYYINSSQYLFQLCGKQFKPIQKLLNQNRYSITSQMFFLHCLNVQNKQLRIQTILNAINKLDQGLGENKSQQYMKIVLERSNQPVLLLDGIGYSTTISNPYIPKLFTYDLQNMVNTSINVYSTYIVNLLIKIVNKDQIDTTIPSRDDNDFSSQKQFISLYNTFIHITTKQLDVFTCQNCFIILAIYADESIDENYNDNIIVQITQKQIQLMSGKANHRYLPKKSIAYYKYYSTKEGDLSIEIADNNQYCNIGYFSNNQNPGPRNFLAKIEQNKLVYKIQENKRYYIGIQATESCIFSITIYDSITGATYLEKGKFGFLDLQEGQSKLFWIKSQNDQYLKFISTQTYGQVEIYLNQTTLQQIHNTDQIKLNFSQFQKAGQYPNRLLLAKKDEIYHNNEYYLIGIYAQKNTQATLFYGNEQTPIPIYDKTINDILLKKGDKAKGQYMGESKANFKVKVNSGKLKLTFSKQKSNYSKQFQTSLLEHKDSFDFENRNMIPQLIKEVIQLLFDIVIKVQFQALQDNTVYSLTMLEFGQLHDHTPSDQQRSSVQQEQHKEYIQLNSGQSYYTFFENGKQYIINGFLRDKNQEIIMTSDYKDKDKLSKLNLTMSIDNKIIKIQTSIVMNIMVLSIPELKNYFIINAINYSITLTYPEEHVLWLNIMQAEDFALLPPQVNAIVDNSYTFVAHANNELILDIFSCKGNFEVSYASSRQQLDRVDKKKLDLMGLVNQPHAIRINKYSTTFFKISIPLGIVRWFPLNRQQGIGTGYIDYKTSQISYENNLFNIQLKGKSLQKINNQSKNSIKDITYTLYISSHKQDLQFASQCQEIKSQKILKINYFIADRYKFQLNSLFSFKIQKSTLIPMVIGQRALFATIVCDVVIQPNNGNSSDQNQRYRFIYPSIQIPEEIIVSQAYLNSKYSQHFIIVAIILITISFIIISAICIKKIIPLLARLKNRFLLEEDNNVIENSKPVDKPEKQLQGDLEVPMSSDRNGIQKNNTAIETDDYLQAK